MIAAFEALVGRDNVWEVRDGDALCRHFLLPPRALVRPADAEQCAAVLARAAELALKVVPYGGGNHQRLGNVPRPVDVVLWTAGMSGIVDHDAADETLIVRAGTRLADLVVTLREAGQMIPLDPSGLGTATIGGVAAAGATGRLRTGFGTPRDCVLGTRAAHSDGTVSRSGGRLVKNVTGFDLHRLYCGSLGTLAVLTEVSLRLKPLPEREATLAVAIDDAEALDDWLARLRAAPLAPVSLALVDSRALARLDVAPDIAPRDFGLVAFLRFFGLDPEVARAIERVRELAGSARLEEVAGAYEGALWAALREAEPRLADGAPDGVGAMLKLSVPAFQGQRSIIGGMIDALAALAAARDAEPLFLAEPWTGLLRMHLDAPPSDELLAELESFAREKAGGRLAIESGPLAWRADRDTYFGGASATAPLASRLKRALDPGMVLSPGRIVRGGMP